MTAAGFFNPFQQPEHRCQLPTSAAQEGWRCSCGKAYVRFWLPERDVLPGETAWQWHRAPEHDRRAP